MAAFESHVEELQSRGYTLLDGVLSKAECARIGGRFDEIYSQLERRGKNRFSGLDPAKERVIYNIHNKDYGLVSLVDHPALLPLLSRFLDDTLVLNFFNAREPLPGCEAQRLHLDSRIPFPQTPIMLQAIWMIDDFTKELGATRVVPGSHLVSECPDSTKRYPDETIVTGKAGSAIVYNSSLWHGSSERTAIAGRRWGIIATYTRWFIKPSMDFTKNTPQDLYARLTPKQKQLLGFNSIPPHDENLRTPTLVPVEDLPEIWDGEESTRQSFASQEK